MGFRGEVIGPPQALFMALLGIFAAMLLYGGTHLIVGDLL